MIELSHIHRFVPGADADRPPLLLLHGTGGDESDLLPLGAALSPGASLLSPRGRVLENGMPRFFRRLQEGVFDEQDVVRRAGELASFVAEARKAYGLAAPVAVGFSNGANIAAAMLLLHPEVLAGAVLLRAMTPLGSVPEPNSPAGGQPNVPVLILSGENDPIVTDADVAGLARILQRAGADVTHKNLPTGHVLTQMDLTLATQWLQGRSFQRP